MKNLGRGLASATLKFCVLFIAIFVALGVTLGKPDLLKKTLKDSGIYANFTDSIIEEAQKNTQEKGQAAAQEDIPIGDAAVQQAIKKSITPEFAQSTAEQIVDGTYTWLDGRADKPTFHIDLAPVKQNLANNVGDAALQRLQGLPVCTTAQLRQVDPNNIDPFNLPCRPPGIDPQAEKQKLVGEALNSDDFLKDSTVSADNLKQEGETTSPFEKLSIIPKAFQFSRIAPWVLGVLGLLAGAGVVFWDRDRRHGLKVLARTFLIVSILLLISALITKFIIGRTSADSLGTTAATQTSTLYIIRTLANTFNNVLFVFATVYGVLGVGGLAALHFTKPARAAEPEGPVPHKPKDPTERPALDIKDAPDKK
ncbi:MAG TPA: hypothetical protein VK694_01585 [Verrucomicrobiae bacterium]|nr:hypothetical protein [Verrucomicrobiae bacterium]